MLSTIDSSSNPDFTAMTPQERYAFEQRLEDEYVSGELTWAAKKRDILNTWAELASQWNPITEVSTYIKSRLRKRGVPESSINYVHEVLDDKYKNEEDRANAALAWKSMPVPPSILEDFDVIAKQRMSLDQLRHRSKAEKYEIMTRRLRTIKGLKTMMSDEIEMLETIAKEDGIKIPDFEKVSADIPPERFHGQSEMYYSALGFADEHGKMQRMWKDIAQTIFHFRPNPITSRRSAQLYEEFKESQLSQLQTENMILLKAYQHILTPISDSKWGELLSGWFKIGRDQQVNYGSNGAGVKNAIPTGYIIVKEYKDGRRELIEIDRGWTKEQVSDRMERDLIKLALIQTTANKIEKAHRNWITNTNIVELISK
jgi:hypothetical protein